MIIEVIIYSIQMEVSLLRSLTYLTLDRSFRRPNTMTFKNFKNVVSYDKLTKRRVYEMGLGQWEMYNTFLFCSASHRYYRELVLRVFRNYR